MVKGHGDGSYASGRHLPRLEVGPRAPAWELDHALLRRR